MTSSLSANGPRLAVTFWGAARRVTGSLHLVEAAARKILLDCGLALGPRFERRLLNRPFPFPPKDLDAVIISHAHIDHCGNLPNLVRQGYRGPVFATPATRDLLALMLGDSARIEEEDAFVREVLAKAGAPGDPPLYTRADVHQALGQCVAVPYDQDTEAFPGLRFRLVDAGHILGSAMVALTATGPGGEARLTFTGDLGRPALKLLKPPAAVPPADVLLCESTYGGRLHESVEGMMERLAAVVRRCAAEGGKVLIPAFSLGRTQLVVHYLEEGIRGGLLPPVPLYVDSPLGADITEVYRRYPGLLEGGSTALAGQVPDGPADPEPAPAPVRAHYVRSKEEAEELNAGKGPCVIVASGGMCEGGHIMRYLPAHIDDPRCGIVLVSYQAPGTVGRRLLERGPTVRFRGRSWNKWAEVVELSGFSGHADRNDLLAFLQPLAGTVRAVRLIHGEPDQAAALAADLGERGFADVAVPCPGDTVRLG